MYACLDHGRKWMLILGREWLPLEAECEFPTVTVSLDDTRKMRHAQLEFTPELGIGPKDLQQIERVCFTSALPYDKV